MMHSEAPQTTPFPSEGRLPKSETRADKFVSEHPSYDGRGIVVAVMDTGVDPGAIGLQVTSDGRPKVIDIVDATGAGDVDVSTERSVEEGCNTITGLTGRELKLNSAWINPSRKFFVGIKRGYELFPARLITRLKSERTRDWHEQQRSASADLQRQIADSKEGSKKKKNLETLLGQLEKTTASFKDPGPLYDCVVFHDGNRWQAVIDVEESGDLSTKEPMTDYCINRQYSNFGPRTQLNYCVNIYDPAARPSPYAKDVVAVVAAASLGGKEGTEVDGESGPAAAASAAAATSGKGLVLSIVTDCGSHGSHVAGTLAGYHEGRKDTSGVAPGAQIVSIKIGDNRTSGDPYTGVSMTRGLMRVLESGAQIINLSYGGPGDDLNVGRIVDLAAEVTNRFGVIFVSCAGNSGPALTTIESPGGTSCSIIGVGAFLSPSMKAMAHSHLPPNPNTLTPVPLATGEEGSSTTPVSTSMVGSGAVTGGGGGVPSGVVGTAVAAAPAPCGMSYTFSSRGPAADGHRGVCISAPGGAIAPVSNWELTKGELMQGTSMSSPNAAGCVALILSGLVQMGVAYSPHHVRRALENTAVSPSCEDGTHPDPFALGCGIVQVDAAFDWLCAHEGAVEREVWFDTTLPRVLANGRPMRGVYLRAHTEMQSRSVFEVRVVPRFKEAEDHTDVHSSNRKKIEFEKRLTLRSTAPEWLECPAHLVLMSKGKDFPIGVDPTRLPSGTHSADVLAYDADAPERGPIFRFPVTVVKPLVVPVYSASAALSSSSYVPTGSLTTTTAPGPATAGTAGAVGVENAPTAGTGQEAMRFPVELLTEKRPISRKFVQVPPGATWADIKVTRLGGEAGSEQAKCHLVLHTVQLLPHQPHTHRGLQGGHSLGAGDRVEKYVAVEGGVTMELCVAQNWDQPGQTSVQVEVEFHSLVPSKHELTMTGGCVYDRLTLTAALGPEQVEPQFELSTWTQKLSPVSSKLTLLPPRDSLPGTRHCYQLVLTYKFTQAEEGYTYPRVPDLKGGLESQLMMLMDSRKRLLDVSEEVSAKQFLLAKGSYEVRLQLRHHLPSLLKRYTGLQLQIRREIASAVKMRVYATQHGAVTAGRAGRWGEEDGSSFESGIWLRRGGAVEVFVREPSAYYLPTGVCPGDELTGTMSFNKSSGRPGGFRLKYVVPAGSGTAAPAADTESNSGGKQDIADQIRDLKLSKLEELSGTPAFSPFHATLMQEYDGDGSASAAATDPAAAATEPPPAVAEKKPYMPLLLAGLRHALACAVNSSRSKGGDAAAATAHSAVADANPATPAAATTTPDSAAAESAPATPPVGTTTGDAWLALVGAADAVVAAVDAAATAQAIGQLSPEEEDDDEEDEGGGGGGVVGSRKETRKKALSDLRVLGESQSLRCLALLHLARLDTDNPADDAADAAPAVAAAAAAAAPTPGAAAATAPGATAAWGKFRAAYAEAGKWCDLRKDKYCALSLAKDERAGRTGAVMKRLRQLIAGNTGRRSSNGRENPCGLDEAALRAQLGKLVEQLGWNHVTEYEKKWALLRDPVDYPLF